MPHVTEKFGDGRPTYNCGVNTIVGGRLVMPDGTTGNIIHAALNTKLCLGVATDDALPDGSQTTSGYNVTSAIIRPDVAVARVGIYRLWYAANCAFGTFLVAAANGYVTPYTSGTSTFDQIVGRCDEPGGVVIATNVRGRVRLLNL